MNDELIQLRLPKELYDRVWDAAAKEGKGISATVRTLLNEALDARDNGVKVTSAIASTPGGEGKRVVMTSVGNRVRIDPAFEKGK